MKSSLIYSIAIVAGLWVVSKMFGIWSAVGVTAVLILVTLWNRRATLLTQFASQAYYVNGDTEKGERLYKMAYKTGLMTDACKIAYSSFCLRENQFEKGRRLLNEIINSKRANAEDKVNAKHNLAVLMWKEGNLEEAIELLEVVHKERTATNTYGTLGVLYLEKVKKSENYSEVLDFMLEAYDYNDGDKTIADNLGELFSLMGEYEKAKDVYSKLLEKEYITPMPYYNYGLVLKKLGDTEGARENFEKALTCRFTSVLTVTKEMVQEQLDSLS